MGRILYVTRAVEGGAYEHVANLSKGALDAGHEVAICGPLAARADDLAAEVIPVEMVRPLSPRRDVRAVFDLARVFRRFRPDLIHSHDSKGGAIARVARFAAPAAPLVHTAHGYAFAGYFTSSRERATYRLIERVLSPLTTCILCVCDAEADLASTICPRRKIRVVHNGVDAPDSPEPRESLARLRESGPLICVVSGLRPGKGIDTLIDALTGVLAGFPQAKLVIAGDGEDRERLRVQAERLGVLDSISMIGDVEDVYGVLAATDLFVLPSWAESFPYSMLEAMAAGLPIVATDVGGVKEAIEDSVTGLLVSPRRAEPLSNAISQLLGDPATASRLGSAAAARQRERFSLDRMIERTLAVYDDLLPAGRARL